MPIDKSINMSYNDSEDDCIEITDEAISIVPKIDVFENDDINQAVQNYSKALLAKAKEQPDDTEVGAVIEFSKINEFTDKDFIIGEKGKGTIITHRCQSLGITIHNHPSGETFSILDIKNLAYDDNCLAVYVVGNNGKMYALVKTSSFDFDVFTNQFVSSKDKAKKEGKLFTKYDILREAERYGFKYITN